MKSFLIGLVAGILILLLVTLGFGSKPTQPISFNHKKHVTEQKIECVTCHGYVQKEAFAGMPTVATCLDCHSEPLTKNPEEEKIRQFKKAGQPIRWSRIYGEPDHVFFPHQAHVVLGKLDCKTCHGNMGARETPPTKPFVRMSMGWCMNCHAKQKVTNDCLACHI